MFADNRNQPFDRWLCNSLVNPDCIKLEEVLYSGKDTQHLDNLKAFLIMFFFFLQMSFSKLFNFLEYFLPHASSRPPLHRPRVKNYYFLIKSKKIFSTE